MWSSNSYRYTRALITAAAAVASVGAAVAAEDLAALRIDPQRDQTADQLRRDRYECHNWAVEQTGQAPIAASEQPEQPANDAKRDKRAERASRAILGAAIGSVVGGIAGGGRGWHHENDAVLTGAAVGAGVGAASVGSGKARDKSKTEAPQAPSDYVRALSACLEGRGYTVTMPSPPNTTARR